MSDRGKGRVVLGPAQLPAEGEHRVIDTTGGVRVLIVRRGGRLHALDDVCNHAGCRLSEGRVEATRVTCPCHYMAFDLRDGRLLSVPRLAQDQRVFPVEEREGHAVVQLDSRD